MPEEKWVQDSFLDTKEEPSQQESSPSEGEKAHKKESAEESTGPKIPREGENPDFDAYLAEHPLEKVNPIKLHQLEEAKKALSQAGKGPSDAEIINWAVAEKMRKEPGETHREFERNIIKNGLEETLEKLREHREKIYKEWLDQTSPLNWTQAREIYEDELEEKLRRAMKKEKDPDVT